MGPIGDLLLTREFLVWIVGPPVVSILVVIAGLLMRRRSPRARSELLALGVGGFALSLLWIGFLIFVDPRSR